MTLPNCFKILMLLCLCSSCKSDYKFLLNAPKKVNSNEKLKISFSEKGGMPIDSVQISLDGKKLKIGHYNICTLQIRSKIRIFIQQRTQVLCRNETIILIINLGPVHYNACTCTCTCTVTVHLSKSTFRTFNNLSLLCSSNTMISDVIVPPLFIDARKISADLMI